MKSLNLYVLIALFVSGCANIRSARKYELGNGVYDFREDSSSFKKVHVYVNGDTVRIFKKDNSSQRLIPDSKQNQIYLKKSFDVDVMTIAFKYRPGSIYLPRQLTTDFNGNVFIGYRLDRFMVKVNKTPVGTQKSYHHRAITMGGFGGLASTSMTPWTTNNRITDEYNGLILSRGLVVMIGVNNLTVGGGVGWDYLTDRDKEFWIYQNKPWYGLTVGLNIN